MHYSRAMASLGGKLGGDNVKKVSTYQQKESKLKPMLFLSKATDVKCEMKKHYMSHWISEGMPGEFIVENTNSWDIHPINIAQIEIVGTNYDVLAESNRGP
jgi:hypothetical protein